MSELNKNVNGQSSSEDILKLLMSKGMPNEVLLNSALEWTVFKEQYRLFDELLEMHSPTYYQQIANILALLIIDHEEYRFVKFYERCDVSVWNDNILTFICHGYISEQESLIELAIGCHSVRILDYLINERKVHLDPDMPESVNMKDITISFFKKVSNGDYEHKDKKNVFATCRILSQFLDQRALKVYEHFIYRLYPPSYKTLSNLNTNQEMLFRFLAQCFELNELPPDSSVEFRDKVLRHLKFKVEAEI